MDNTDIIFDDRCYGTNNFDQTYDCMGYTIKDVITCNKGDHFTIHGVVVNTDEHFNAYIDNKSIRVTIGKPIKLNVVSRDSSWIEVANACDYLYNINCNDTIDDFVNKICNNALPNAISQMITVYATKKTPKTEKEEEAFNIIVNGYQQLSTKGFIG